MTLNLICSDPAVPLKSSSRETMTGSGAWRAFRYLSLESLLSDRRVLRRCMTVTVREAIAEFFGEAPSMRLPNLTLIAWLAGVIAALPASCGPARIGGAVDS